MEQSLQELHTNPNRISFTANLLSIPCRARDFQLNLAGAVTLQELQMKRLQLLEAYERQRLAVGEMIQSISMF